MKLNETELGMICDSLQQAHKITSSAFSKMETLLICIQQDDSNIKVIIN